MRNVATGCKVRVTFTSTSDGTGVGFEGRWSGHPEPFTLTAIPNTAFSGSPAPTITAVVDPTKFPQTRVIDVSPGEEGQVLGIAIKTDKHSDAFGFASESYAYPYLENPEWKLPKRSTTWTWWRKRAGFGVP